jgi:Fic family protein
MANAAAPNGLETPQRIEPCRFEVYSETIADLVAEVAAKAQNLGTRLHPATARGLADSVRAMNCYYSNLIEGHNTRPRDIERALAGDLDEDETKRAYQVEARNHIRLQRQLDNLHAADRLGEPASAEFIAWLHREFYKDAPDAMLWIGEGNRRFKMTPGVLRSEPHEYVTVGRHQPPSSARVTAFVEYFEQTFASTFIPLPTATVGFRVSCRTRCA